MAPTGRAYGCVPGHSTLHLADAQVAGGGWAHMYELTWGSLRHPAAAGSAEREEKTWQELNQTASSREG